MRGEDEEQDGGRPQGCRGEAGDDRGQAGGGLSQDTGGSREVPVEGICPEEVPWMLQQLMKTNEFSFPTVENGSRGVRPLYIVSNFESFLSRNLAFLRIQVL